MSLAGVRVVEEALKAESRDTPGRKYDGHRAKPSQGGHRQGRLNAAERFIDSAVTQPQSGIFHGDEIRCQHLNPDYLRAGSAEAVHPNDMQLFSARQLDNGSRINATGHLRKSCTSAP